MKRDAAGKRRAASASKNRRHEQPDQRGDRGCVTLIAQMITVEAEEGRTSIHMGSLPIWTLIVTTSRPEGEIMKHY